jgi:hypothetical protein
MDLVNRKMRMNGGAPFATWMKAIGDFIEENRDAEGFAPEMGNLAKGFACVKILKELYDSWYADIAEKRRLIPLHALKTLFVCAQVQVAECLMEQALIAKCKLDTLPEGDPERTFYAGKIAAARYYVNQVLPQAFIQTEIIRNGDRVVLDVPEEALVIHH